MSGRSAALLGGVALVFVTGFWLLDQLMAGAKNRPHGPADGGDWLIGAGLAGVIFGTYGTLAALGYGVSLDGRVHAPKMVTWLVTAFVTIVVLGGILAILNRN